MVSNHSKTRIQSIAACLMFLAASGLSGMALSQGPGSVPVPGSPGYGPPPYGPFVPPPAGYPPAIPVPPHCMNPAFSASPECAQPPGTAATQSMQNAPGMQGRVFCRVFNGVKRCWRF